MPFLMLAALAAAPAPQFEDLAALDQIAAEAAGGATRPIDRRIRLARCAEPVIADPPALGAVALRCASRGWRLRVVVVAAARTENVVRRGDAVELAAGSDGFSVTTQAIALDDGGIGQPVRVKTSTGAAPVSARVTGAGAVSIGG